MNRKQFFAALRDENLVDAQLLKKIEHKALISNCGFDNIASAFITITASLIQIYLNCWLQKNQQTLKDLCIDNPKFSTFKSTVNKFWDPHRQTGMGDFVSLVTTVPYLMLDDIFKPLGDTKEEQSADTDKTVNRITALKIDLERTDRGISTEYSSIYSVIKRYPILRICNYKNGTISINGQHLQSEAVRTTPILCISETYDGTVDNFYVLSTVIEGDRNGELMFTVIDPFMTTLITEPSMLTYYVKSLKLESDSDIALSKTMNVYTDWNTSVNMSGDYYFIDLLADAIVRYINDENMSLGFVIGNDKRYSYPKEDLLDLFFANGVYRTVQAIMLTSLEKRFGNEWFKEIIKRIYKIIDRTNVEEITADIVEKCEDEIRQRSERLHRDMPYTSDKYDNEIAASIRARYIMQTTNSTNPAYLNKALIFSIDDYIDSAKAEKYPDSLLINILNFVIGFYSKALNISNDYSLNNDCSLDELNKFVEFIKYINSEKRQPIIDMFGRKRGLCDEAQIQNSFEKYIKRRSESVCIGGDFSEYTKSDILTKPFYFVVYAHEDKEIVASTIIPKLRRNGVNIYFDEQFGLSDNWYEEDKSVWDKKNCLGIITFLSPNSILKDAVFQELRYISSHPENQSYIINWLGCPPLDYRQKIKDGPSEVLDSLKTSGKFNALNQIPTMICTDNIWIEDKDTDVLLSKIKAKYSEDVSQSGYSDKSSGDLISLLHILKHGTSSSDNVEDDAIPENCIYPMLVSVKETTVNRDRFTLSGYEIVGQKKRTDTDKPRYLMIPSGSIKQGDYFCVPNKVNISKKGIWMYNPYLVEAYVNKETD